MNNLGYYNGKIGPIEEMTVPMTDRAFYFGDGVYDAVLCRNDIPYLLSVHLERFYKNCGILNINIPMEKNDLSALIEDLVKRVEGKEKFIYFFGNYHRFFLLCYQITVCKTFNLILNRVKI